MPKAGANRERTVVFDEERLAIVRDRLGDVLFSTITARDDRRLPSQAESGMAWATAP